MKLHKTLLNLLLAGCLGAVSAGAATFNFTGNNTTAQSLGDSISLTASGITVTATAYSTANTTGGTALTRGAVDEYSANGLGVCNATETAACASAEQQVDNNAQYDFILFKFSTPINLSQIVLKNVAGSNSEDLTYWTRTLPVTNDFTLSDISLAGDGFTAPTTVTCNACGIATDSLATNGINVSAVLVGAGYTTGNNPDATPDYFEISSLSVTTPEPASFELFALSIASLILMRFWWKLRNRSGPQARLV